jgi:sulfotransferase
MEQFVCLSGLPRAGSTLLSAILSQNPLIHAEGNSAVCQLMWDMQQSCLTTSKEQLLANCREKSTKTNLISQIPYIYYKDIKEKIVVDKCRSWTINENITMLESYIDKNYKIIILERSVTDIVKSFVKLYNTNGVYNDELEKQLLIPNSEPLMRSISGVNWAKKNNKGNHFLFINYDDLIDNTEATINRIYDFCGWEYFTHDFKHIECKYPEDDSVYGLKGMHKLHNKIVKKENSTTLSSKILKKCTTIDKIMGYISENSEKTGL